MKVAKLLPAVLAVSALGLAGCGQLVEHNGQSSSAPSTSAQANAQNTPAAGADQSAAPANATPSNPANNPSSAAPSSAAAPAGPAPVAPTAYTNHCYVVAQGHNGVVPNNYDRDGTCMQVPSNWKLTATRAWHDDNTGDATLNGAYYDKDDYRDPTGQALLRVDTDPDITSTDPLQAMRAEEAKLRKTYPQFTETRIGDDPAGGAFTESSTVPTPSAYLDFTFVKDGVTRRVHIIGTPGRDAGMFYVYFSAPVDSFDAAGGQAVLAHATKLQYVD